MGEGTTITLLVTERDARKIELARTIGELSLSLVGEQDPGVSSEETTMIDMSDLLETGNAADEEIEADAVAISKDPRTGKQVKYELRDGKWIRAD